MIIRKLVISLSKTSIVLTIFLSLVLSLGLILFDKTDEVYYEAQDIYRVYLDGKSIGVIKSKSEFEAYINEKQQSIKDQYNVKRVYEPTNLKIEKEITYNEKISSVEDIYSNISNEKAFTIDGYVVTIKKKGDEKKTSNALDSATVSDDTDTNTNLKIYLLNKSTLNDAINETVKSFVDKDKYEAYLKEQQQEILDEGTLIENVYIEEEITIKKDRIPVNEKIFYDHEHVSGVKELTKYLIFGNLNEQKIYKCKASDTLASIAEANKLNIKELLVANSDLSGEDALLYEGQQLIVNLIEPKITVTEVTHEVAKQTIKYDTIEQKDSSMYTGQSKTVKKGENGEERVTKKVQRKNGFIVSAVGVSSEVIKEPVDKIVKIGTKRSVYSGSYSGTVKYVAPNGYWAWPTRSGYCLTSNYAEYRSYERHYALDISCTGLGSPIYAAQGGTVTAVAAGYGNNTSSLGYGNYVEIDHGNGYVTLYAHLNSVSVGVGQVVSKKQVIGTMGNSGFSFGTHLHYAVYKNGSVINPFALY